MKKIFNLSIFALLFLSVMSCSTDDNKIIIDKSTNPVLIAPEGSANITINPNALNAVALTLVWDHAAYSVDTAIDYKVEVAVAGTSFAAPLTIANTTNRFLVLTGTELKAILTNPLEPENSNTPPGLGLSAEENANIEVRVTATIGDNAEMPMVSEVLPLTIVFGVGTTEPEPTEPVLFLVGAPQAYYGLSGWDNATAIPMRYIGDGTTKIFEAYVKVAAGEGFKFIGEQGTWDNGNYGTIGNVQDGNLQDGPGSNDVKPADTDGLYYVWVDVDNLQYKAVKMEWGIIGNATPGQWSDETPMTYDFATNKWSIATTLTGGEMKFRSKNTGQYITNNAANSEWLFNVGISDPTVVHNPASSNFQITAGAYTLGLTVNFDGTASYTGL
ncbi:SusE domain-containing protein [uncultured Flavobacterium sp.]|uniref:SusE domain-containing protein n=1 Tax=uncultured Flavobacterium sp. TaxID=165435 RepID=UPI0025FEC65E|nr:SusE domain-containing protein [uncultured Flavobacterium sp.]